VHRSRQVNLLQTFSACELPLVRKLNNRTTDFKLLRGTRRKTSYPFAQTTRHAGAAGLKT